MFSFQPVNLATERTASKHALGQSPGLIRNIRQTGSIVSKFVRRGNSFEIGDVLTMRLIAKSDNYLNKASIINYLKLNFLKKKKQRLIYKYKVWFPLVCK